MEEARIDGDQRWNEVERFDEKSKAWQIGVKAKRNSVSMFKNEKNREIEKINAP